MKSNLKEEIKISSLEMKRQKYITSLSVLMQILVHLGIIKIWYEPNGNNKFAPIRCEKMVAYNPLTWIWLIITFFISIVIGTCKGATIWFKTAKSDFITSRYR